MSKEFKSKYGASYPKFGNNKVSKPHPLAKRKSVPASNHLTNTSANVVLFERNVEIKDLESKVKYLQSKIKELENENRTLTSVQLRQERELKHFKEGVADIPSLLRSHKEETKVYESTISNIRRELRDCQKELKIKNEVVLKKDSQIDKLKILIKRNEEVIHDLTSEIKEYKAAKTDIEKENKRLIGANKDLGCEIEGLNKKIKDMCNQMQNLEENLSKEINTNKQLKDCLSKLQEEFENKKREASGKKDNPYSEEYSDFYLKNKDSCEVVDISPESECRSFEDLLNEDKMLENSAKNNNKEPEYLFKADIKKLNLCEHDIEKLEYSLEYDSKHVENSFETHIKKTKKSAKEEVKNIENSLSDANLNLQNFSENECKNSFSNKSDVEGLKKVEKSFDKTKDILINAFNCYQDLCDGTKLNYPAMTSVKTSNKKLLPPLKKSSKKTVNKDSAIVRDGFLSDISVQDKDKLTVDKNLKNENSFWHCKEFHFRLKPDHHKISKSESKISIFREAMKKGKCADSNVLSKQNILHTQISLFDDTN